MSERLRWRVVALPRRLSVLLPAAAMLIGPAVCARAQTAPDLETPVSSTWKPALEDSLRLLLIEHGTRMMQPSVRRNLEGPFVRDYRMSLRVPTTWDDGDSWVVNYIGHPVQGSAAARIWLDNLPAGRRSDVLTSRQYWANLGVATAWSTGYSLQFEFGPLSEASIGNVGLDPRDTGWTDHVVTPLGGMALTVAEDALDRYLISYLERRTSSRLVTIAVRILFNPGRSLALGAEGRVPWVRDNRPLRR